MLFVFVFYFYVFTFVKNPGTLFCIICLNLCLSDYFLIIRYSLFLAEILHKSSVPDVLHLGAHDVSCPIDDVRKLELGFHQILMESIRWIPLDFAITKSNE